MTIIECQNVGFSSAAQTILTHLSFSVKQGDSIGIVGPSGSGKSTLFRLLNLLLSPTSGTILYKGKPLQHYPPTEIRRQIGYILQKPYLFGTTVKENLLYPYQLINKKPDMAEILSYLAKANLAENILDKKNTALSGGEQQRIALIRSLLVKPEVILLDEVTAALDEENTLVIEQLLTVEKSSHEQTLLFITHNKDQANRLANTILQIESGQMTYFGDKQAFFKGKEELAHE